MRRNLRRVGLRTVYAGGASLLLCFTGLFVGVPIMFALETFGEVLDGSLAGIFAIAWMAVSLKLIMMSADLERFAKYLMDIRDEIDYPD